jgi:hypothetical protein
MTQTMSCSKALGSNKKQQSKRKKIKKEKEATKIKKTASHSILIRKGLLK